MREEVIASIHIWSSLGHNRSNSILGLEKNMNGTNINMIYVDHCFQNQTEHKPVNNIFCKNFELLILDKYTNYIIFKLWRYKNDLNL